VSLILLLLSHSTSMGTQKSNELAAIWCHLDSTAVTWRVWLFHTYRRTIMSHNSVTEIKKKLTCSNIGTHLPFHRHMTSKTPNYLFHPPLMQEPSSSLGSNPISIWWFAGEARRRGEILQVWDASLSENLTNHSLRRAQDWVYSCLTAVSQDTAYCDCFLAKESMMAFTIFWGQCQDTRWPLQSLLWLVRLHHHPFAIEWLPDP